MSSLATVRCAGAALALAAPLLAREGEPLAPHDLWTAWSFEPGIVIPLALAALLYWRGSRPLWSAESPGRGIRPWEALCFWAGWLSLFLALCSPLHPLGEVLFSAHMVQHEILMLVAAPLLVLGRPLVPFLWALPGSWRKQSGNLGKTALIEKPWHFLSAPAVATFLQAVALWIWHAPVLYQATLDSEWVHAAQHLSFMVTALLFWWAILRGSDRQASYGAGVLYLFITLLQSSMLGALLTFSTAPWYPAYAKTTAAWGTTPWNDQIVAGLIMWGPAGMVYVGAAVAMCASYLKASDRKADLWASTLAVPPTEEEPVSL
jgi:putative membrane protein